MTTITIGDCVDGVVGIGRASLLEERFSVRVTAQVKNAAMEKEYVWVAKVSWDIGTSLFLRACTKLQNEPYNEVRQTIFLDYPLLALAATSKILT